MFRGIPFFESLLHIRICEEGKTKVALDRPIDDAGHVRALDDLGRGNHDLMTEAGRVRECRAIDDLRALPDMPGLHGKNSRNGYQKDYAAKR